ncbi:phospholipid carrier-dependent glycosyltransferase [bacterium]|nr:phospholipid carrier-dependent glycosyltransferase [bacterium]
MIGDLAFLILLGVSCIATGSYAWKVATGRFPRSDEWLGIALPLGLGLCGTIVGIAASTISFLAGFAAVVVLSGISAVQVSNSPEARRSLRSASRWFGSRAGASLVLLTLVLILPGLVMPVIDGDALCYHLEVARRMVQDDIVRYDPDLHETAYPLLVESLQAVALKCRGPVATRAVSFWFGIALAFGSTCLAGALVKGQARYWAATLVLITPVVHCGTISPLNDVALAAMCTSSLAAWVVTEHDGSKSWRRFALVGVFCGFACGVKFPGIVWLAVITGYLTCVSISGESCRRGFAIRTTAKAVSIFAVFAVVCGSFWYGRAAILTGNPVHPYFRNTFGGHGLDEVLEDARKPIGVHFSNIATAPLVMALSPSRFDSFSHQSGPLFLALIPLGFLQVTSTRWKSYVFLGWLLMALCLTQRQSPRFFVTTFALWSAAGAATISSLIHSMNVDEFRRERIFRFSAGCICLLGVSISAFDLARVRVGGLILAGQVSPHAWLESNEPTSKLRSWVSQNLPENARLVGQDHRGYYWPRRFTMEKAHRRRTGLLQLAGSPEEVVDRLRSAGFTHLVMAEPDPVEAVEFDTDLSVALAPWLTVNTPMVDVTLPEIDGYVRRYRIYDIDGTADRIDQASRSNDTLSTSTSKKALR